MISYESIYNLGGGKLGDIHRFRQLQRDGFNSTDNIDTRFFKIFFYFQNQPDDEKNFIWNHYNGGSTGLLAPTWIEDPEVDANSYYKYNSAWAYLKNNYEEERASALETFISLLSNISIESPWYFQSINGLDEAMVRNKWKVDEERKKITLKCLPDATDYRIESLLALYRSIVWSQTRKCEVLPANLRKFDMGIFIFSGLIKDLYVGNNQDNWATMGNFDISKDRAVYKYIEFHNCEFDIDSIKSGYSEVSNELGFENQYSIDIFFDECYEHEFNPFLLKAFGDFFIWDSWTKNGYTENGDATSIMPDNDIIQSITGVSITKLDKDIQDRLYASITTTKNTSSNPENIYDEDRVENDSMNNEDLGALYEKSEESSDDKKAIQFIRNTLNGEMGNIYGKGRGLRGIQEAAERELQKQAMTLKNKAIGNITDLASSVSREAAATVVNPITGSVSAFGSIAADTMDQSTQTVKSNVIGKNRLNVNRQQRDINLGKL